VTNILKKHDQCTVGRPCFLRLLLVAVIGELRPRFQRQRAADNGHERNAKDGCRGQGDGLNDNRFVTAKPLALGCSAKVLGAAVMISMCSKCNELQKQGAFLSVFSVVREKKPNMFLSRDTCLHVKNFCSLAWSEGNRKGNSFPAHGQKMDFTAQKQGKFHLVWLSANC
jgi:hypothetical protein